MSNEYVPTWILRNLDKFGNCAVSRKSVDRMDLISKLKRIYKNMTVETKEGMVYISTNKNVKKNRKEINYYGLQEY